MSTDIMFQVAGEKFDFTHAKLHDYFRSKIHSEEYPAIVGQTGAKVTGIVYFDIPPAPLHQLDLFEGEFYKRLTVDVILTSGDPCKALTYAFKPEYHHMLTGEEWCNKEFLLTGKKKFKKRYFGFQEIDKPT